MSIKNLAESFECEVQTVKDILPEGSIAAKYCNDLIEEINAYAASYEAGFQQCTVSLSDSDQQLQNKSYSGAELLWKAHEQAQAMRKTAQKLMHALNLEAENLSTTKSFKDSQLFTSTVGVGLHMMAKHEQINSPDKLLATLAEANPAMVRQALQFGFDVMTQAQKRLQQFGGNNPSLTLASVAGESLSDALTAAGDGFLSRQCDNERANCLQNFAATIVQRVAFLISAGQVAIERLGLRQRRLQEAIGGVARHKKADELVGLLMARTGKKESELAEFVGGFLQMGPEALNALAKQLTGSPLDSHNEDLGN